jgi:hypothetical protein
MNWITPSINCNRDLNFPIRADRTQSNSLYLPDFNTLRLHIVGIQLWRLSTCILIGFLLY